MEALATLGIVANICQFIEYGYKIVREARRLRNSGTGSLDPELERDTQSMAHLASKLGKGSPSGLSVDEMVLNDLATQCLAVSKELLAMLDSLKAKRPRSRIESMVRAFHQKRRSEDIDTLEKKLDRCRSQLQIQLTTMMR